MNNIVNLNDYRQKRDPLLTEGQIQNMNTTRNEDLSSLNDLTLRFRMLVLTNMINDVQDPEFYSDKYLDFLSEYKENLLNEYYKRY